MILDLVLSFLAPIVVALVTVPVTANWALRRFSSERWWEERFRAYSEIIEALYVQLKSSRDGLERQMSQRVYDSSGEDRDVTQERLKESRLVIERMALTGKFLLSDDAVGVLHHVLKESALLAAKLPEIALWEIYESDISLRQKALQEINRIAKKDLGIQGSQFSMPWL